MQNITIDDLKKIRTGSYHITYILPELDKNQTRYCKMFLTNIYKWLFDEGSKRATFDPEAQIVTAKINGEKKTLIMARDYTEQDKLLTYSFDVASSLSRLANTEQKMDILKVMPNEDVLDANLMPLCVIKEATPLDRAKLYCGLINNLNNKGDFVFSAANNTDGTITIYYGKQYSKHAFSLGDGVISTQDNRSARAMRMFNREAIKLFDFEFFLNNNITYMDELGNFKEKDVLYPVERRGKLDRSRVAQTNGTDLTPEDFRSIDTPEGVGVFALKEYVSKQEANLLKPLRLSANKTKINTDKLSLSRIKLRDKDYLAILCAEEDLAVLNRRASVVYATMRNSHFYMNDDKMFYYLDANNDVIPLSHAHLCCTKLGKGQLDRLTVALEHGMGSTRGHEIVKVTNGNITDYFFKVVDTECYSAQSYIKLANKKETALKSAIRSFDKRIELLQNDGAPMAQTEVNRLTNSALKSPQQKY